MPGFTPRAMTSPGVDLASYRRIGLVSFSVSAERGGLDELATQRFCDELIHTGLGLDVVELGSLPRVLRLVGRNRLDEPAVTLIATRWNVAALLLGQLTCTSPRWEPIDLRYGHPPRTVAVTLSVRVLDTAQKRLLWSRSLRREESLAPSATTALMAPGDDAHEALTGELLHELCAELGHAKLAATA